MSALLTASRLKTARSCQRKHHISYGLGYRQLEEVDVLRFGTLMHDGLEAWWRSPRESRSSNALAAIAAGAGNIDPFERVKAEELMRGYDARWSDEPYEVLAVEVEFNTELRNPATGHTSRTWRLAGKIDVTVRDLNTGRILIIEHKTSSEDIRPGSPYWRRLRMDGQVSVYYEGAESLGLKVSGCLYDVISKPGIKPLKATPLEARKFTKPSKAEPESRLYAGQRLEDETPEEYRARLVEDIATDPSGYFARGDVVRFESEMADALSDVWQLGQQIRESELAGRFPRNPDACHTYGRLCPFFDVCSGVASLDDPARFFRRENVHPELSQSSPVAPGEREAGSHDSSQSA